MKRAVWIIVMVMILGALVVCAAIAQQTIDPRLAELQQAHAKLAAEKNRIESNMIRLEGMFIERQAIIAEQQIEVAEEAPAEEVAAVVEEAVEAEVKE